MIRVWLIKNNIDFDKKQLWIKHLVEEDIKRNINKKKFMFKDKAGQNKFGYIQLSSKEIKLEPNKIID